MSVKAFKKISLSENIIESGRSFQNQLIWRAKTFWKTQFHPNFYTVTDGPDIRSEQFRNDQHK